MPGHGMVGVSLCGFAQITGWPDREPTVPFGALTDFLTFPAHGDCAYRSSFTPEEDRQGTVYMNSPNWNAALNFWHRPSWIT